MKGQWKQNMRIRELNTHDYEVIHGFIVNEMKHAEVDFADLSSSLDSMKANDSYLQYVAECDDRVVGFISAVKLFGCVDSTFIEITCLVVSEDYQGRGIGTQLMEHIESLGAEENIHVFSVSCGNKRIPAHKFYMHNGYGKDGYTFYKGAVILGKNNIDSK